MFNFITGSVTTISANLKKSFNQLPVDPYQISLKKPFRYRKFSKIKFKNHNVDTYLKGNFFQTKKINRYVGGKNRNYKNINNLVVEEIISLFKKEFQNYLKFKNYELGIHQIRILASNNIVGYPVPEGWHKDGFDYVVLLNINAKNIVGGISRIREKLNDNHDHYSVLLKSGEYIFLNDSKYFHYADPINVKDINTKGSRDIIVLTIQKI